MTETPQGFPALLRQAVLAPQRRLAGQMRARRRDMVDDHHLKPYEQMGYSPYQLYGILSISIMG